jgi:lipopolysaccharide/colanic/teichoic acid biosynthesis glycosyltransferase
LLTVVEPAFESVPLEEDAPADSAARVESWDYLYAKRSFDLLCSAILILALAIPALLIAAAIRLTSKGPVFFTEYRIGRGGRRFRIFKFRSMHQKAAQQSAIAHGQSGGRVLQWRMRKGLRDPRITWVGRFLRTWSLDELPQLFNVLRGDMSLIGPRPIVMEETFFYGDLLFFYLAATPGLTGLWQVSGRSHIDYDKRARLDAEYVRTWTLGSDLRILFRTLPAVLGRVGAN